MIEGFCIDIKTDEIRVQIVQVDQRNDAGFALDRAGRRGPGKHDQSHAEAAKNDGSSHWRPAARVDAFWRAISTP